MDQWARMQRKNGHKSEHPRANCMLKIGKLGNIAFKKHILG